MRVGLVAYLLHEGADYRSAGVSTYIRHLLASLPSVAPQHEYLAFHGADSSAPPGIRSRQSRWSARNALLRIGREQIYVPFAAREQHVDLLHGLVNVVPLVARIPRVLTVHDLAFLRHPERFHPAKSAYLRAAVAASVRQAAHVLAVSESTRGDLLELLDVQADRVTVAYPGVDASFRHLSADEIHGAVGSPLTSRPYILHVGTLEPRKNIDILIRAFQVARQRANLPHSLILAGPRGWMYTSLFSLVQELGLGSHVQFIDWVTPESLPLWYNCADLFAYPSVYEGFGLPVVEAMACGTPVITSESSALRELAGDAARTVEPGSVEALATAIVEILQDTQEQARMRHAGFRRAGHFRWEETARRTAAVYDLVEEQRSA